MSQRPETADLHRRIVAAAVRNGHTPETFRLMCKLRAIRAEQSALGEKLAGYLVRAARMTTFYVPGVGMWVPLQGHDFAPEVAS